MRRSLLTRVLQSQLFNVTPTGPAIVAVVAAAIAAVALVACLPAGRPRHPRRSYGRAA